MCWRWRADDARARRSDALSAELARFCLPNGVEVRRHWRDDQYVPFVLTDSDGHRVHCHCVKFDERRGAELFVSACLVFVTRHQCFAFFRTLCETLFDALRCES